MEHLSLNAPKTDGYVLFLLSILLELTAGVYGMLKERNKRLQVSLSPERSRPLKVNIVFSMDSLSYMDIGLHVTSSVMTFKIQ